nr:iron-containing alcohol dehydrogenase [Micromonospora sp. DSM 115978]
MTGPDGGGEPHRVAFTGTVSTGALTYADGDLVVVDTVGAAARPAGRGTVVDVTHPPRLADARRVADLVRRHRPRRLVAAGDGATLDVAKQGWLLAAADGPVPALRLAPLGAEAWRAFAPFTSLYEPDGRRISRRDPALGAGAVLIDATALAGRAEPVRHLQRADSTVHALEVLVSRRSGAWARALAAAGLAALRSDDPEWDVVAAGLITEAFASTGLGLAHALASPLGVQATRPHDAVNVLLAPYVVEHWGDRVDWTEVADGLGTAARAGAVAERLRVLAGLAKVPDTLRGAGFDADTLAEVVPLALRSSGIGWLPAPVDRDTVAGLLCRAWAGR